MCCHFIILSAGPGTSQWYSLKQKMFAFFQWQSSYPVFLDRIKCSQVLHMQIKGHCHVCLMRYYTNELFLVQFEEKLTKQNL